VIFLTLHIIFIRTLCVSFVRECCTGFFVTLMALLLSHFMGTSLRFMPRPRICCIIHNNCPQQALAAIYSASTVERVTEFCFLECQVTKLCPRNWHVPLKYGPWWWEYGCAVWDAQPCAPSAPGLFRFPSCPFVFPRDLLILPAIWPLRWMYLAQFPNPQFLSLHHSSSSFRLE